MTTFNNEYLNKVYAEVSRRNKGEDEFLQAVEEVLQSLEPVIEKRPELEKEAILEKMVEPERFIQFQVPWEDDNGNIHVNRGFRVQFNGAVGPYKGGLRLHPSVNGSIVKFLGFEQTFKNALTGLPMGGGKGGSDFDPKGKSDSEVRRFCQSFMTELYRHIGQFTDVPAGDIGVGGREIGYLFGQYKKIQGNFTAGVLTGKAPENSGSLARKEATGYGLLYIVEEMFKTISQTDLVGKKVVISGSGNVAIYAAEKAIQLGAKVLTVSDSGGYVYDENGINLDVVKQIKEVERGRLTEYVKHVSTATYHEGTSGVWSVPCDVALPCATQNEVDQAAAKKLVENGVVAVAEGSNMSTTPEGIQVFLDNKILYLPGKASNAGGVSVSGLEMSQNSLRYAWTFEEVDEKLKQIMIDIFHNINNAANEYGMTNNFMAGANIDSFLKVAQAMIWQG